MIPSCVYWVPDVEPVNEHLPIDTLAHGLDRVLFKCVIQLQALT